MIFSDIDALFGDTDFYTKKSVDLNRIFILSSCLCSHLLVLLQSKVDFQHSPLPYDSRGDLLPIR